MTWQLLLFVHKLKTEATEDRIANSISKSFLIFHHAKLSCVTDCASAHRKAQLMFNSDLTNLSLNKNTTGLYFIIFYHKMLPLKSL